MNFRINFMQNNAHIKTPKDVEQKLAEIGIIKEGRNLFYKGKEVGTFAVAGIFVFQICETSPYFLEIQNLLDSFTIPTDTSSP